MAEVTALFWDIGGVILTNGWDRAARRQAAERFELDWDDFQDRHEFVAADFETGRLTLAEYLERTVFYRSRLFTAEEFEAFMRERSQPLPGTLEILAQLAGSGRHLLATLNNESLELNRYRIERFRLRDYFSLFLSSSFLGIKKPDVAIYRLALQITQRNAAECVFIDDRALNLECARGLGIRTIHYRDAEQLRAGLAENGVDLT